jgi:hypothetical protein
MPSFRRPRYLTFLRVFSVVWLVILVGMIVVYLRLVSRQDEGVEADGTVVERTGDETGSPTVVVRYTTGDGASVDATLTGTVQSGEPRYDADLDVGDPVRLRVHADDPTLVRLADDRLGPAPLYYFGFFLLVGIGMAAFAWWPGVSRGRRGASGGGRPR